MRTIAEYIQSTSPQLVAAGQNLLLIDSISCNRGYVIHRNGSGILTLRGITGGNNCFARYAVEFNGNIAIPTGGAVAPIAIALSIDGEPVQSSRAIVTPAAVGSYSNVTCTAIVTVPKGCCNTIAVENVPAGVDVVVAQQAINVADGNLRVTRIS